MPKLGNPDIPVIPLPDRTPETDEPSNEPTVYPDFLKALEVFQDSFHPQTETIYYPGCGVDTTPSHAFPKSRIQYVDVDERHVKTLREHGHEAVQQSAKDFVPDKPVDVCVLFNSPIWEEPAQHVRSGGYVLCNDYKNVSANKMRNNPGFRLVGAIRMQDGNLDTENLEDYSKQVATDEELLKASQRAYQDMAKLVETITGKTGDTLATYKKIQEIARAQTAQMMGRPLSPGEGALYYNNGEPLFIPGFIPTKKSTGNTVFLYQKK